MTMYLYVNITVKGNVIYFASPFSALAPWTTSGQ